MIYCGQGQKVSHNSMRTHYKNVMLDNKALNKMHALQHGNPRNLYGKHSPIHRLLHQRDSHGLFSQSKVLGIRKLHADIHGG